MKIKYWSRKSMTSITGSRITQVKYCYYTRAQPATERVWKKSARTLTPDNRSPCHLFNPSQSPRDMKQIKRGLMPSNSLPSGPFRIQWPCNPTRHCEPAPLRRHAGFQRPLSLGHHDRVEHVVYQSPLKSVQIFSSVGGISGGFFTATSPSHITETTTGRREGTFKVSVQTIQI